MKRNYKLMASNESIQRYESESSSMLQRIGIVILALCGIALVVALMVAASGGLQ